MPEPTTKTEVIIANGAFYRAQTTYASLGRQSDVLERLSGAQPVTLRNVACVQGQSISIARINPELALVYGILPKLEIRCRWQLKEGKHTPQFWRNSEGIETSYSWEPPGNAQIVFAVAMTMRCMFQAAHLILKSTDGAPGWWRLPLSNTYDDGRLCLGDLPRIEFPTMADCYQAAKEQMFAAPYNSDLAARVSMDHAWAMIRFNPETGKQVAPSSRWTELLPKVNNTHYNSIVL